MTNREAIDILRCKRDGDAAEALEVVLKAAEAQPCEDAVSREAVREGMTKYGFRAPDMTVTEFVEDELPPVTIHHIRKLDAQDEQILLDDKKQDIYDRLLNMLNDTRDLLQQLEDRGLDDQLIGAIKVVDIITRNVGGDIDEHRSGNE